MDFTIRQLQRAADGRTYEYEITSGNRLVGRYWHDHKSHERSINFVHGHSAIRPVGSVTDFIEGGGPQPLRLTAAAMKYLTRKLGPG